MTNLKKFLVLFLGYLTANSAFAQSIRDRFTRNEVAGDVKDYMFFTDADLLSTQNKIEAEQELKVAEVRYETSTAIFEMKKKLADKRAIAKEDLDAAEREHAINKLKLDIAGLKVAEHKAYAEIWQHNLEKELHGMESNAEFLREKYLAVWQSRCDQRFRLYECYQLETSYQKERYDRAEKLNKKGVVPKEELLEKKMAVVKAEGDEKIAKQLASQCESFRKN